MLVLSRLRNLERETRRKVAEISITYDITKDGLYKEGIEQGKITVVKKALLKKKLSLEEIADLVDVSVDFILSIQSDLNRGKIRNKP